ncbi:MAG: FliA/WhiG family RNA polymerase sigma factor [Actinomycetota bacterium]|nr:FliA/WhiG family RNA polymerase sigma factor [Actinomycetota bacterium]
MDIGKTWREFKETGSPKLKEALILQYASLVNSLARGIHLKMPPDIEYADLVSYGFLGLMDAIDRFDTSRGKDFCAYAKARINGSIIDGIRSEKRLPRSIQVKARRLNRAYEALSSQLRRFPDEEEMAKYLDLDIQKYRQTLIDIGHSYVLSLDDIMSSSDNGNGAMNLLDSLRDDSALDPSVVSERESIREMVREAMEHLPEREKIILSLYYFEDLNMKEVGEVLDITESRVSQIHSLAMAKLKTYLSSRLKKQPA